MRELRDKGAISSESIQAAFLAVARERFVQPVAGARGLELTAQGRGAALRLRFAWTRT